MRVVLRQLETGFYLQPDGIWSQNRASAKEFPNTVVAYWSALDGGLEGTEVWLLLENPKEDFVGIKVQSGLAHPLINCEHWRWAQELHFHLYNGLEVELMSFDPSQHGSPCDLIAQAFAGEFTMEHDTRKMLIHFRRKSERHELEGRNKPELVRS